MDVLSIYNDKLLVSSSNLCEIYVFSWEGSYLSTIKIEQNDELYDATWTPYGNIVYTTYNSKKVVLISDSGDIITTHFNLTAPNRLSVSNDCVLYLADWKAGVYQSTDGGLSWSLVFKSKDGRNCLQVINVKHNNNDDFWTVEQDNLYDYHLRVYSVNKTLHGANVTWKDINVVTTSGKHIKLSGGSRLSYDGNANIYLSDPANKAVHLLSVNGQYQGQPISSDNIKIEAWRIMVDKERNLLYVGQRFGVVGVFTLIKGDEV